MPCRNASNKALAVRISPDQYGSHIHIGVWSLCFDDTSISRYQISERTSIRNPILETGNAFWLCWMLQNTFPLWFPWKAFAQLTFPHTYHAHNFTSPFWGNLNKCGLAWLVVTCWSWSRIPSCILFNSLTCTKPKQSTLPQPWHLFQRPFKKPALIKLSGSFITSRINNCINLRRLNWSV